MRAALIFTLALLFFNVEAQQQYQDVIYLKNGSMVKGMIVEFVPNVSYTIRTSDNSLFVFKIEEILKIAKEPVEGTRATRPDKTSDAPAGPVPLGYAGIAEIGYGLKSGPYGFDVLNVNLIYGYQFTPDLFAGIGTGFKHFPDPEFSIVPFFAEVRYAFLDREVRPFVGLSAGYAFSTVDNTNGALLNPQIGVQIRGKGNIRYNVALNYQMQQLTFNQIPENGTWTNTIIRFSESVGFTFGVMF